MEKINQDRKPNFREGGKLYLVRCYACDPHGRENYSMAVASGKCAWCGWDGITTGDKVITRGVK